jgi:hypothetical protein
MRLVFEKVSPSVKGIYGDGVLFRSSRYLHPEAAESFEKLEDETGGLVYTGMRRTAEASLAASRAKQGVQPPGYSGHNYGLSVDVAIEDFTVPGGTERRQGTLTSLGLSYPELLAVMEKHGWYCHRRDRQRGFEEWHFNFLEMSKGANHYLAAAGRSWALAIESLIQDLYGASFDLRDLEMQEALQKLGLYGGGLDGIIGPRSKEAIWAFQRAWKLTKGPADGATQRTLAFVAAEIVVT